MKVGGIERHALHAAHLRPLRSCARAQLSRTLESTRIQQHGPAVAARAAPRPLQRQAEIDARTIACTCLQEP